MYPKATMGWTLEDVIFDLRGVAQEELEKLGEGLMKGVMYKLKFISLTPADSLKLSVPPRLSPYLRLALS
jgi:hypothetical protein